MKLAPFRFVTFGVLLVNAVGIILATQSLPRIAIITVVVVNCLILISLIEGGLISAYRRGTKQALDVLGHGLKFEIVVKKPDVQYLLTRVRVTLQDGRSIELLCTRAGLAEVGLAEGCEVYGTVRALEVKVPGVDEVVIEPVEQDLPE